MKIGGWKWTELTWDLEMGIEGEYDLLPFSKADETFTFEAEFGQGM
jgi:hypothetical protein